MNPGELTNSPRLEQLIHDNKLELSLQDAIALAMENSMDIVVQRYNPWMADVSMLKTQRWRLWLRHAPAACIRRLHRQPSQSLYYDPFITQTISLSTIVTTPINNPFISGIGTQRAQHLRQLRH